MDPHCYSNGGINPYSTHYNGHFSSDGNQKHQYSQNLFQQITASTREGHDEVNRLIMSRLALGLRDHTLYREGILSFAFVYKTFEEEWASFMSLNSCNIDLRIKTTLQSLYSTPLLRTPQLTKDLHYYFGPMPFSIETPTTLQRSAYVAHIRRVVAERPHVLIAYAYNYYMALFAGGKILKYQISNAKGFFPKRYGMTKEERIMAGTNLFCFMVERGTEDRLGMSFKEAFSDLDSTLTAKERNDIIEESKTIFSYNILLIKELDHICANLDTTSPSTSDKMASRMSDRDKFLAFVLFLGFFLIAKNAINSSGANSYILS